MTSWELNTNTSLALWYYWIIETSYIDTLFKELSCIYLRQLSIVKHYRTDSTLGWFNIKTSSHHLITEVVNVLNKLVMKFIALLQHLEHFKAGTDNTRCKWVREEVWTTALTKHVNDFLAASSKSSECTTKCLTECTCVDIHTIIGLAKFTYTMTCCTNDTSRVRLINHHESVILLSEVADLVNWSNITIHWEHTISNDDTETLFLWLL